MRTRAAFRIRAISPDGLDIAIAAEEPIEVLGFAVDLAAAGSAVIVGLGCPFLGAGAYVSSGSYKTSQHAAASQPHPPEYAETGAGPSAIGDRLSRRGFKVVLLGRRGPGPELRDINQLARQSRAAVEYYHPFP